MDFPNIYNVSDAVIARTYDLVLRLYAGEELSPAEARELDALYALLNAVPTLGGSSMTPRTCCTNNALCPHCYSVAQVKAAEELKYAAGLAPNGYAAPLAAMAPRLTAFEERYRDERLKALEAERADVLAHEGPHRFTTLDDSDLERYRPPNAYAKAIEELKAREARR
jgi:hypothetical protein